MRKTERKRIVIGWVLFLTLLAFLTVKTVHHHPHADGQVCEHGCEGSSSDEDTCPICHFTLSPFVQTEPLQIAAAGTCCILETEEYAEAPCLGAFLTVSLRAPPVRLS